MQFQNIQPLRMHIPALNFGAASHKKYLMVSKKCLTVLLECLIFILESIDLLDTVDKKTLK